MDLSASPRIASLSLSVPASARAGSAGAATALGATLLASPARAQDATPVADEAMDGLSAAILEAYKGLPGHQGITVLAPPDAGQPAWSVEHNADDRFFIASVFKAFALAECLRQAAAESESTLERTEVYQAHDGARETSVLRFVRR